MNIFTSFPFSFNVDELGIIFAFVTVVVFVCSGIYSFEYMKKEENRGRYAFFYLAAFAVETAMCFASNLQTLYLCFELLTLMSVPLVLHECTKESIMASLKYMLFSLFGAYMALFGIYFLAKMAGTTEFVSGGSVDAQVFSEHPELMMTVSLLMIVGFGVKAGMWPMHAWLPTAHPVAPAPASAVLSAVIVKAGILGIVRSVYYVIGVTNLKGSIVQTVWMIIALITVFMGSMLAYREPVLKKRLAYSTVSQLSYISFGLAVMNEDAFTGSLLHVLSHGFIKAVLFLTAGAIIHYTGITRVDEMTGVGRKMPVTMWCYTICSLGLIGIPPMGGFVSKWYLAIGSLESGVTVLDILGPVVLLVSALLTAGYLLPLTIKGFFPGENAPSDMLNRREPSMLMVVPIVILTVLSVVVGLLPNGVISFIADVCRGLL